MAILLMTDAEKRAKLMANLKRRFSVIALATREFKELINNNSDLLSCRREQTDNEEAAEIKKAIKIYTDHFTDTAISITVSSLTTRK